MGSQAPLPCWRNTFWTLHQSRWLSRKWCGTMEWDWCWSKHVKFLMSSLCCTGLYLSRGNHESKSMNKIYGFDGEVKAKFNETMADLFAEVFCCLPLANVLNEKIFVVHGGLFSSDDVKLSDIRAIDRFQEPPDEGMVCHIWVSIGLFSSSLSMNFNQCIEHMSLFKPCLFTSDTWASYENLGAI